MEGWRARWEHFRRNWHFRLLTSTAGSLFAVASFATWIRDEFVTDTHISSLRVLNVLPHWPWQAWGLAATPFMFASFFEGTFRQQELLLGRLKTIEATLAAIADSRPVSLDMAHVELQTTEVHGINYLRRIAIPVRNRSRSVMRYRSSGGYIQWKNKLPIEIPSDGTIRHLTPDIGISHYLDLGGDYPLKVGDDVTLKLVIEYDDFRDTRWRKTGREVVDTIRSITPSSIVTLIKGEIEE